MLAFTPYATLEHVRGSRGALRAGSDEWAQLTGYAGLNRELSMIEIELGDRMRLMLSWT